MQTVKLIPMIQLDVLLLWMLTQAELKLQIIFAKKTCTTQEQLKVDLRIVREGTDKVLLQEILLKDNVDSMMNDKIP